MDTTQVSVFCAIFLRSFGCYISFPFHTKILRQELWKRERELDKLISGDNRKVIKDWVKDAQLLGTVGVNRLVGGTALGDTMILQIFRNESLDEIAAVPYTKTNIEPRNKNPFSDGKKGGTFTSNNSSQTRIASTTLCSKIERDKIDFNCD